jgi:hypothetical protein
MGSEVLFRGIDQSEDRRTQQLASAKKKVSLYVLLLTERSVTDE